jgi:N-acetyl-alpha-D-glucosaminyl L-malate synthase BshA
VGEGLRLVGGGEDDVKIGITCYPTYGGSGAVATELGIALAARGWEVHFITYQPPFRLPEYLPRVYFHEVDVGRYPLFQYPPYDLALAVRMHQVVIEQGLEILHVHYAIPHATSAWIAREMLREQQRDVKVITTLHGTDITLVGQEHSFHAITKFSIEKSDRITAVSQYLKDETIRAFGCAGHAVDVIPNFIDPNVYDRARWRGGLHDSFGHGAPVLMHISNFRPVKRVTDVIRIFARVRAGSDARLIMVGDGPDRTAAEEEARALGVHADVQFLGRIENVAPLLAAADVFLLPSETESFGLSALEALACGVPVIASDVGGLPQVVRHGDTGFLAPVGDVDAMAEAARRLVDDPTLRATMGAAAAADARVRFSLDAIVAEYERLYAEAVA